MKILLLTDGSPHSAAAARWLADNARKLTAPLDIHLLHVHLPLPYPAAAAVVGRGAVERYFHEASEEALAGVAEILQRAQLSFEKTWIVGEVTPAIAASGRPSVHASMPHSYRRPPAAPASGAPARRSFASL